MTSGLENLKIYKLAEKLEKVIYKVTESFPKEEKYRKVNQSRRASSSTCDNIAEGYGKYSFGAKINCFYTARGEAEEIRRQVERVKGKYIEEELAQKIIDKYTELIKGINGYIRFLKNRQNQKTK